jgi:hypothetical protein
MKKQLQKDIILHYKGILNYDIVGELIGSLKEKMRQNQIRFGVYKKILTLMIESLENIIRYRLHFGSKHNLLDEFPPEFSISASNDFIFLETVNPIFNNDMEALKERINRLNKFGLSELKELYKEIITNGQFSEKGGAGLGLIEMAKIVDDKINISFNRINEDLSYFHLMLAIKKISPVEDI